MKVVEKLKPVGLIVLIFLVTTAVTGCVRSGTKKDGIKGTVKVAGSTSVQPLAEELAEAFMEKNPGISVSVFGGGSSAGIEAAGKGTAQIGTSARELSREEKGYHLTETVVAKDGIAVIINLENRVTGLTMDQVRRIFTGKITDWSEAGGKKGYINVVIREEGSGTRKAFEEIALGKGVKFVANATVLNFNGVMKTSVARDVNAIGFVSLGSVDETLKIVKVDQVEPSEATVLNGKYKISRPFLFLTKSAIDPSAKAFIDFVLSEEGQRIVSEKFVRIK